MDRWQGIQHVVVVGLGITGLSVVNYLQKFHPAIEVKVIDTRDNPPSKEHLPSGVTLHSGGWNLDWLLDADLIVANPGIALATPEIQQAMSSNIPVVGDIELFAWHVQKPVIAITGSNGKSTVTDLMGVLGNAGGLKTAIGGNIGVPALDLLSDDDAELYVLELSSFQLETTSSLITQASAFLNLSEDHMDRYDGMESYRQAKLRIFANAETFVVNADDPQTFAQSEHASIVSFGLDNRADYTTQNLDGQEWLVAKGKAILPVSELSLVGRHNIANVLTVLALLEAANISYSDELLSALKSYTGLTHRCQVVEDKNGVKWVNDSKATNVASTLAALSGLELQGKLYLLVGGLGKGADFSSLKPVLAELPLTLCCFGTDAEQFLPLHPSAQRYSTMDDAVKAIHSELNAGDMVLLSPACASMDQFKNFMHRGDVFAALAKQYA